MVLDIVAIVTPAPGKEARVEEILKDLTAKVEQHEPDVAKYMAYKSQNAEGATEYVFVERYVMLPHTSPFQITIPVEITARFFSR